MASGWAWLAWLVVLLVFGVAGWAGWIFYNARRQGLPAPPLKSYIPFANRSGQSSSNYPTPRTRNPIEWIKDQVAKIRNRRTHEGAFENGNPAEQGYGNVGLMGTGTGGGGGASRGRGRGLEDDAWDTRVGNEDAYGASGPGGYHEEQELGLAPTPGYSNEPYSRSQADYIGSQNTAYGGGGGGGSSYMGAKEDRGRVLTTPRPTGAHETENPFSDEHAAASMRSVSPRPAEMDGGSVHRHKKDNESLDSNASSPTSTRRSHFREGI